MLLNCRRGRRSTSERLFEGLSRLELGRARGGNLDGLAGLGVATRTGLAIRDRERSEAGNVDLLSLLQGLSHVVQQKIEKLFCARPRHVGLPRESLDEV